MDMLAHLPRNEWYTFSGKKWYAFEQNEHSTFKRKRWYTLAGIGGTLSSGMGGILCPESSIWAGNGLLSLKWDEMRIPCCKILSKILNFSILI